MEETPELWIEYDPDWIGFTKVVNRGIRNVGTEFVCILNDDIPRFGMNWLLNLREGMDSHPLTGFVGPSGNCRTEPQRSGNARIRKKQFVPVGHLAWFCVLIRMSVFDEIGLLDESFLDYGSDVDFQWRAQDQGWISVWCPHVYIWHDVGEIRQPNWDDDQYRLMQKHGPMMQRKRVALSVKQS
jgi:GT2 family glycosyltransferase